MRQAPVSCAILLAPLRDHTQFTALLKRMRLA